MGGNRRGRRTELALSISPSLQFSHSSVFFFYLTFMVCAGCVCLCWRYQQKLPRQLQMLLPSPPFVRKETDSAVQCTEGDGNNEGKWQNSRELERVRLQALPATPLLSSLRASTHAECVEWSKSSLLFQNCCILTECNIEIEPN